MEDNTHTSNTQEVKEETTQVVTEDVVENAGEESTKETLEESKEEESQTSPDENESQDDEDSDDDEALAAIKKVRNEAKNLRKRLKEAEVTIAELRAKEDGQVVQERDALKAEVESLKKQIRDDKIGALVRDEAEKMGAIEPAVVVKLIDLDSITLDDKGKPTNLKEVLTETRNEYKRLFMGANGSGNVGSRDERGASLEGVDSASLLAKGFKRHDD